MHENQAGLSTYFGHKDQNELHKIFQQFVADVLASFKTHFYQSSKR